MTYQQAALLSDNPQFGSMNEQDMIDEIAALQIEEEECKLIASQHKVGDLLQRIWERDMLRARRVRLRLEAMLACKQMGSNVVPHPSFFKTFH